MKTFLLPLLLLSSLSAPASEAFKLSHRSEVTSETITRNPFWPIGWSKSTDTPISASAVSHALLKPEDFLVSSILLSGDSSMAVINGKEFSQGESKPVQVGGQKIEVQVVAIQDGEVILAYDQHNLSVPLRRK